MAARSARALARFQQSAVATEARAEGRHPPITGRRFNERPLQDVQLAGAADVSQLAQHRSAVIQLAVTKSKFFTQGGEHVTSARVPNPARDLFAMNPGFLENRFQD